MVLLLDIIRRFSPRGASQWIHNLTQAFVNKTLGEITEKVDDDLRSISAMNVERIGHADNLTTGHILPKGQEFKAIYEGAQNELALWLYMNDVSNPNIKDRSGWDGVTETTLLFDGVNDTVDLTNDASLWSQSLTQFSFSFWIYPTAGWDGNLRKIVVHGTGAQSFECVIDSSVANRISFQVVNAAASPLFARSTDLKLNQWNFVTCVYDNSLGSANLKIYVNAVVGATTANLTEAINKSAALTLSDATNDFKGQLKDFRFWTTTALSQVEIDGLKKKSPVPAPDYWLKITNGGTGNPVDAIEGKIGTLNGTVWNVNDYTKIISRVGYPCVVKTTQDFIGRKLVGFFNGIADGLLINDQFQLQVVKNQTGISISEWIYLANDELLNGEFRILYSKKDDANNYIQIFIDPTSQKIVFRLSKNGSEIKKQVVSFYSLNTWVFAAFVWDFATNAVTIYKNAVSQTTSNWTGTNPDLADDTNAHLFYNNTDPATGFSNNAAYNFKFWSNKKLIQQEITNENTNKFSISNIALLERPVAGFMTPSQLIVTGVYNSSSYNSSSYTT